MSEPIIDVQGACLRYPGASVESLIDADLTVGRGDAIGVVGESGSGKTTLARAIVGVVAPTGGRIEVLGEQWPPTRRKDPRRRQVQMVFQDPYASLNPRLTALDAVPEVAQAWRTPNRADARRIAGELLEEVGLAPMVHGRRPGRLSGGQCQRVGIARALAAEPTVLVADEPTSALDVSVQAQILDLLLDLRTRRDRALVLISHDLAVVRSVTDTALVMYRGRIVERGATGTLLEAPAHPYTRVLVDSIPGREGERALVDNAEASDAGCPFARRCWAARPECEQQRPQLEPTA